MSREQRDRLSEELELLLLAARDGDTGAQRTFYESVADRLSRFIRSKGVQDHEDILHDVFLAAFYTVKRYEPRGRPMSWLFKIAMTRCRKEWDRKSARSPRTGCDDTLNAREASFSGIDPTEELQRAISDAMFTLAPEHQQLLALRSTEQTINETVATLEMSKRNLHLQLAKARKLLSSHMQDHWPEVWKRSAAYVRRFMEGSQ